MMDQIKDSQQNQIELFNKMEIKLEKMDAKITQHINASLSLNCYRLKFTDNLSFFCEGFS